MPGKSYQVFSNRPLLIGNSRVTADLVGEVRLVLLGNQSDLGFPQADATSRTIQMSGQALA
jgi:hypothetical protein